MWELKIGAREREKREKRGETTKAGRGMMEVVKKTEKEKESERKESDSREKATERDETHRRALVHSQGKIGFHWPQWEGRSRRRG